ncbi:MAG: long-chain fatty acid--CoA ligase [Solirubrobacteraceae bacterium]|nr:long-chain fatty acid--CoA ligase [Solirubrobacteraceae bacterium]
MSTENVTTTGKAAAEPSPAETRARTIAALVLDAAERFSGVAMRSPEGDVWTRTTYPQLGADVRVIAKGLIALGVKPGDRVAILSNTRAEWTLADFGAMCAGAVVVPVYQTNSPEECEYVLDHSGAMALFCEDGEQLAKIAEIRDALPKLEHLFRFDGDGEDAMTLDALRAAGADVSDADLDARVAGIGLEDLATIVYTSGTTGPPKGCMLTHGNLRADIDGVHPRVGFAAGDDVVYVFLPLAHVLTRIVQLVAVDAGAEMAYWRRDPKKIVEDVQLIKPTHLPSVPRIFEKIHAAATAKAEAAGGAKAKIFHWAIGVGRQVARREDYGGHPGLVLKAQHALAEKLVLHKIRDLFGGRMKLALSGAAPIDTEILEFFRAAGIWVLEGYGMTETCAVETLNTIDEHRFGTVGKPLPGVCEVKIAEDGEILMRGPNIFQGYYNNAEATAETLTADGWLHSGDLGELDEDGYLSITGRKKDLIITSSGKNISPSNVENALKLCRWISQAVVFGDRRPYLTALLTIDPDEAGALAEKVGAASKEPADLAKDPAVRKELQGAVDDANRKFARIEQVKKFKILERDLSQDNDELTPTLKVKRNVVYESYRGEFKAMYDAGDERPKSAPPAKDKT